MTNKQVESWILDELTTGPKNVAELRETWLSDYVALEDGLTRLRDRGVIVFTRPYWWLRTPVTC